ncbi:hypothetical protein [Haliscomenobacter hydrossis]|uniref:Uncharacterized protein n=1 Tax=Haliscomenobacter hydrossis (strain ATCC 27775 / DSM 1100 / LMG 10767 / O) TaxID=760192 RepID=F4KV95_HALH1|nr:hypothetical protein [Haliscomenobacter hydrossis]AEE50221.1 hypothetical protein Halhy_2345 [Haliscomenobacter hydrossis DSM 1100]
MKTISKSEFKNLAEDSYTEIFASKKGKILYYYKSNDESLLGTALFNKRENTYDGLILCQDVNNSFKKFNERIGFSYIETALDWISYQFSWYTEGLGKPSLSQFQNNKSPTKNTNIKTLINQIELACSPMSNYDFKYLRDDKLVQAILRESNLYIIAQRSELSFENLIVDKNGEYIKFEIHQKGNAQVLKCKLPYFQPNIATDPNREIHLYLGSHVRNKEFKTQPYNDIHGIKFYHSYVKPENFIVYLSPEVFIINWEKGYFQAEVEGDFREFLRYKLHYIGKATDQDIWKRLTGHETLQDILAIEYPFNYGSLPTHEIALLFLKFRDNLTISSFDENSSPEDMVNSLLGYNMPEQRTIYLDAEKALVKAMLPKHNKIKFKNYPKSKDGLEKHNFSSVSYTLMNPITLISEQGEIEGGIDYMGGDTIIVKDNRNMEIIKYK